MLQVNFQVDDKVVATIQKASRETSIAAVLVVMEKETMKQLGDAIPASGSLASDLEKVRSAFNAAQLQAGYAIVYGGASDPVTLITYTSDSAKAKERMLYSSGTAHLRDIVSRNNTTRRTSVHPAQAATVEEIQPNLFQRKETAEGRAALMTESERRREEIARMPVAPQPTIMPGVQAPLSNEAMKLLPVFSAALTKAGGMVLTFKIEDNQIVVDKQQTVSGASVKNEQLAAAKALLPADEPRYVLTDFSEGAGKPRTAVMVYVCPGACPPRVKMPYASCKASFLNQLGANKIHVERRTETSSAAELPDAVQELFASVDFEEKSGKTAGSTKPPGARGPRMLI